MQTFANVALGLLGVAVLIATLVLFLQVAAFAFLRGDRIQRLGRRVPAAILIPAHNEAQSIASVVSLMKRQMGEGDRLLVVADNCIDATAALARAAGAEVVERRDPDRRGKGYALSFGLEHLTATGAPPVTVTVIVDADCVLVEGALSSLVRLCELEQRPVQGRYIMRDRMGGSAEAKIGEFAWRVRNHIRPAGLARLGLPCHLMGTGMAFPTSQLQPADLATGHITEDMLLGVHLTLAGHPPIYCPTAVVASEFPSTATGRQTQKERWVHGHLSVILEQVPLLLFEGIRRRSLAVLSVALDIAVPPLSILLGAMLFLLPVTLLWASVGAGSVPLLFTVGAWLLLASSLALAWRAGATDIIQPSHLMAAPAYVLRLASIGAAFLVGMRSTWTRSDRE